jgi:glutamine---fructose-6-phosphate transaminase (isomerizing)
LENKEHLYVIGRGLGLCAAQEIALKCKETCGLHAEAYSSAELRHGPLALLGRDFPALLLAQRDAARPGIESLAAELANRGIPVMLAGGAAASPVLDLPSIDCAAEIAPLLLTLSAYRMIATLALRRGFDPDRPAHLSKVTETM